MARRGDFPEMRPCANPNCRQSFEPKNRQHTYCCKRCKNFVSNARNYRRMVGTSERPCGRCGTPTPLQRGRYTLCEPCREKRERPRWPKPKAPTTQVNVCEGCARWFEAPVASAKRFCSPECRRPSAMERRCACGLFFTPTWRPNGATATECWMCRSAGFVEGGKEWRGIKTFRKAQLVRREMGECQDCGATEETSGAPLHAHHVVPQALGGTHELSNLRLLCEDCHNGPGWARNHASLVAAGLVIPPPNTQLVLEIR